MEIRVFSTLAYEKGNPYLDKQTYIARDTWMPSLENWGGGLVSQADVFSPRAIVK